jgi:hypothetical protein
MSSTTNASSTEGNDRPSREVAYRLFAAEFDDASFSYSESDEERAPNYVVTPTGARVNRLFAVGVLTEVEAVNDDVLRGRLVDPTGAFVSYAGQYQPDEMAFLDRASPPAFVALSGKARTFQPDDSDRVFTSVRPESMSRVDADTRDRWTVSTAEATLERIGVMAAALQSELTGETLREALLSQGVDESLATGIPLALDHYSTTPAYLAALRQRAVEALEVVADERDSVQSLDLDPASAGDPETPLAALAADLDLSGAGVEPTETTGTESVDAASEEASTTEATQTEATPSASESARTETVESPAGGDESPSGGTDDPATATEEVPTFDDAEPTTTAAEESSADTTAVDSSTETAEPTEPPESTEPQAATSPSASTSAEPESTPTREAETTSAPESEATETPESAPTPTADTDTDAETADGLDDFDDGSTSETPSTDSADDGGDLGDFDDDGMYELDESERAAVEEEFGTEFSTGSEVAPAGEADIDVPSAEEVEADREEVGADREKVDGSRGDPAAASEPGEPTATSGGADDAVDGTETTAEAEAGGETDAVDVDLEAAAVEAMAALDDGDGASREAVVGHVVDEYGVDPGAVEDAIQSALMSGQCYEPTEDSLKAI